MNKHYEQGEALLAQGKVEEAIIEFDLAIQEDPNEGLYLNSKAAAYYQLGDYPKAHEAIDKALQLDSRDARANNLKGQILLSQGVMTEALTYFDIAVAQAPNQITYWRNKADAHHRLDDYAKAHEAIDKALQLDWSDSLANSIKGLVFFSQGKQNEAQKHFDMAIEETSEEVIYWIKKADSHYQLNDYAKAHEAIDKALQLNSRNPSANNLKGLIFSSQGEETEALSYFAIAVEEAPNDISYWCNKAKSHYKLDDYTLAHAAIDKALQLNSSDEQANDLKYLIFSSNEAAQLNSRDEGANNLEGFILLSQGQEAKALQQFDISTKEAPDETEDWDNKANAHHQLKDHNTSETKLPSSDLSPPIEKIFLKALRAAYQHPQMAELKRFLYEDTFPIAESFINIAVVDEKEIKEKEAGLKEIYFRDGRINSFEEIHKPKRPIPLAEMFNYKEEKSMSRHILVEGRAGIGKSVLCQYLANQWAIGSASKLPSLDDQFIAVIWLPLRRLARSSADTIVKAIYECCLIRGRGNIAIDQVEKALHILTQRGRILYLLDGYDEVASFLEDDSAPINELLNQLFMQEDWLITSRPYYVRSRYIGRDYRHLEIIGFNNEEIAQYVHRFFADFKAEEKEQGLQTLLKSNVNIKGIAHIPINLELICSIWLSGGLRNGPISMTNLYDSLLYNLAKRYLKRKNITKIDHLSMNRIIRHEKCKGIIKFLEHLAWKSMKQAELIIKPCHYQSLVDRYLPEEEDYEEQIEDIFKHFGILKGTGYHNTSLLDQEYYFIHLTFQEYFAARYVVDRLDKLNNDIIKHKYDPRYEIVWWFVAGLLAKDRAELNKLFGLLLAEPQDAIGWTKSLLMMRCLQEAEFNIEDNLKKPLLHEIAHWVRSISLSDTMHRLGFYIIQHYLNLSPQLLEYPIIMKSIQTILLDKNYEVQKRGIFLFEGIRNPPQQLVDEFLGLVQSRGRQMSNLAISVLGRLQNIPMKVIVKTLLRLLAKAESGNDGFVESILKTRINLPFVEGAVILLQIVEGEEAEFKPVAMQALGLIEQPSPKVIDTIRRVAANGEGKVKNEAILILGQRKEWAIDWEKELVELIQDEELRIRHAALKALSNIETPSSDTVIGLLNIIREKEGLVRMTGGAALASMQNPSAEDLLQVLRDKNEVEVVRLTAARKLGDIPYLLGEVVTKVLQIIADKTEPERFRKALAQQVLGYFPKPSIEAGAMLLHLAADKQMEAMIKLAIIAEIENIYRLNGRTFLFQFLSLAKNKSITIKVRLAIINALNNISCPGAEIGDTFQSLVKDKREKKKIRLAAVSGLVRITHPTAEVVATLCQLAKGNFKGFAECWGLYAIRNPAVDVVDQLLQIIQSKGKDQSIKDIAIHKLRNIQYPSSKVKDILLKVANDKNAKSCIRAQAVQVLGNTCPSMPAVTATILLLSKDKNSKVRKAATEGLSNIHPFDPSITAALLELTKDKHAAVRKETIRGLRRRCIQQQPYDILTALVQMIRDKDPAIREEVIRLLELTLNAHSPAAVIELLLKNIVSKAYSSAEEKRLWHSFYPIISLFYSLKQLTDHYQNTQEFFFIKLIVYQCIKEKVALLRRGNCLYIYTNEKAALAELEISSPINIQALERLLEKITYNKVLPKIDSQGRPSQQEKGSNLASMHKKELIPLKQLEAIYTARSEITSYISIMQGLGGAALNNYQYATGKFSKPEPSIATLHESAIKIISLAFPLMKIPPKLKDKKDTNKFSVKAYFHNRGGFWSEVENLRKQQISVTLDQNDQLDNGDELRS